MATRMSKKNVRAMLRAAGAQVQAENRKAERSKYGAVKTKVGGIEFASKKEANHYRDLKVRLRIGEIENLELQPEYLFMVDDRIIFRYRADFRYWDFVTHELTVVDVKGFKTPVYRLKKKLIEAQYGITITEV